MIELENEHQQAPAIDKVMKERRRTGTTFRAYHSYAYTSNILPEEIDD
jgi:hypothetical protein